PFAASPFDTASANGFGGGGRGGASLSSRRYRPYTTPADTNHAAVDPQFVDHGPSPRAVWTDISPVTVCSHRSGLRPASFRRRCSRALLANRDTPGGPSRQGAAASRAPSPGGSRRGEPPG